MKNIEEILKSGTASVVDVRTPAEFLGGHVAGSINIPLQELPTRMKELEKLKNIVLCCASGGRSGQASNFLRQNNIDCVNGGSWMDVNFFINQNKK